MLIASTASHINSSHRLAAASKHIIKPQQMLDYQRIKVDRLAAASHNSKPYRQQL
jgi:hypothetical protein